MTLLNKLKQDARQSASFRGHNLMNFETTEKGNRARSHCVFCKKEVHVIVRPQANEIAIGGEAVALGCDD